MGLWEKLNLLNSTWKFSFGYRRSIRTGRRVSMPHQPHRQLHPDSKALSPLAAFQIKEGPTPLYISAAERTIEA